jgi:hypothetical protein
MIIEITITWFLIIFVFFSIIQFVIAIWIKSTLEKSIATKYERILEDYRYNLKVRERAEKIAEYLSLYYEDSHNFQKLNQLSWELSLWLPADIYANLSRALLNIGPEMDINKKTILDILIDIRRLLLKDPGNLTGANIIVHAKDVGRKLQNR